MNEYDTPEERMIKLIDEEQSSTKNIINVLKETKEIGTDTLTTLQAQGMQIKGIQNGIDTVLHNENIAKRHLRTISSLFWTLMNKILPYPLRRNHGQEVDINIAQQKAKEKKPKKKKDKKVKLPPIYVEDIIIPSLEDQKLAQKILEDDERLREASEYLDDLQKISKAMGDEIAEHNQRLDMANTTAEEATVNANDLDGRIKMELNK